MRGRGCSCGKALRGKGLQYQCRQCRCDCGVSIHSDGYAEAAQTTSDVRGETIIGARSGSGIVDNQNGFVEWVRCTRSDLANVRGQEDIQRIGGGKERVHTLQELDRRKEIRERQHRNAYVQNDGDDLRRSDATKGAFVQGCIFCGFDALTNAFQHSST